MPLRYSQAQEVILVEAMQQVVDLLGKDETLSIMAAVAVITPAEPTIVETLEAMERVVHIRHNMVVPLPMELAKKADYAASLFRDD